MSVEVITIASHDVSHNFYEILRAFVVLPFSCLSATKSIEVPPLLLMKKTVIILFGWHKQYCVTNSKHMRKQRKMGTCRCRCGFFPWTHRSIWYFTLYEFAAVWTSAGWVSVERVFTFDTFCFVAINHQGKVNKNKWKINQSRMRLCALHTRIREAETD